MLLRPLRVTPLAPVIPKGDALKGIYLEKKIQRIARPRRGDPGRRRGNAQKNAFIENELTLNMQKFRS